MPDIQAGQQELALLAPRLGELLQDDLGDDMLVWLVLRSLRHQCFNTLQDLAVGGHLPEGRRTDSHSLHLPSVPGPVPMPSQRSPCGLLAVCSAGPTWTVHELSRHLLRSGCSSPE